MPQKSFDAFLHSIKDDNQAHVKMVLNSRYNLVNTRHHQHGLTPLFVALHASRAHIVKHLLTQGADANLTLKGELPIDYVVYHWSATEEETLCVVNKLLAYGATPTSALFNWSATIDNEILLEHCLKAKISINSRNKHHQTPLISAIHANRVDMITRLLQEGADPNIPVLNRTPLEHAVKYIKDAKTKNQVIKNLLHHGAIRTDAFFEWLAEAISQSSITGYLNRDPRDSNKD